MAEPAAAPSDDRADTPEPASPSAPVADTGGGTSIMDMLNDKGTTGALADVQRHKVQEESGLMSAEDRALAEDRSLARNFLHRESAGPDDLQKWDAKGQAEKYRTDPIEQFGSLASVFAITASAFTKAPMENALNGAAAAMNAARANNDKEYDRAYTAWKDNNELVIKRHQMMHTDYVDALSLMTQDTATGDAKMRQIAAKYGDQKILTLLEHGYATEVVEAIQSRAKAAEGIQKVLDESDDMTFKRESFKSWQKNNPNAPIDVQMSVRNRYMGAKTDLDAEWSQMWYATHKFPENGDTVQYFKDHDDALRQHLLDKSPWRSQTMTAQDVALRARLKAKHMVEGMDEETAELTATADIAQSKKAETGDQKTVTDRAREIVDESRDESGRPTVSAAQARLRASKDLTDAKTRETLPVMQAREIKALTEKLEKGDDTHAPMPHADAFAEAKAMITAGKLIDDSTARSMAERYLNGDRTVLQNLGRGNQGAYNVAKILDNVEKMRIEKGMSNEDVVRRIAEFKGLAAGEQTLARRQANITSAAMAFKQLAPLAITASDKVDRTRYSDINNILLSAERRTGGTDVVKYGASLNSLISVYARAMNAGSGVTTDTARARAIEVLQEGWSKKQIRAAIDQLNLEVNAELVAPGESMKVLGRMFTGEEAPQYESPSAIVDRQKRGGAAQPDPLGIR